jgi:hypothetical protein
MSRLTFVIRRFNVWRFRWFVKRSIFSRRVPLCFLLFYVATPKWLTYIKRTPSSFNTPIAIKSEIIKY